MAAASVTAASMTALGMVETLARANPPSATAVVAASWAASRRATPSNVRRRMTTRRARSEAE